MTRNVGIIYGNKEKWFQNRKDKVAYLFEKYYS